jgi:hypothetical protein
LLCSQLAALTRTATTTTLILRTTSHNRANKPPASRALTVSVPPKTHRHDQARVTRAKRDIRTSLRVRTNDVSLSSYHGWQWDLAPKLQHSRLPVSAAKRAILVSTDAANSAAPTAAHRRRPLLSVPDSLAHSVAQPYISYKESYEHLTQSLVRGDAGCQLRHRRIIRRPRTSRCWSEHRHPRCCYR